MKAKFLIALAACLLLAPAVALAQSNGMGFFEGERELRHLPFSIGSDSLLMAHVCGEYFIFSQGENEPDGKSRVAYFLVPRPGDPKEELLANAFTVSVIRTVIDEKKKTPTVTIVSGEGIPLQVVLRISSRDYRRSPCLPPPIANRAQTQT